jgi:hypothetical protein
MPKSFEDLGRELLEAAVEDYKTLRGANGPISGDTLDVTKKGGYAAFITAVVAGIGSIIAVLKGSDTVIVVAALGFGAVALIALALIIRSDHAARAAVTVGMADMVPKLISAARVGVSPAATTDATAQLRPSHHFVAARRGLKVKIKNDDDPVDLVALRFDTREGTTSTSYLVGRPGHSDLQWKSANDVAELT